MQYEFLYGGETYTVSLEKTGDLFKAVIGDREYSVDASRPASQLLSLIVDGRSVLAHVAHDEKGWSLGVGGRQYVLADPAAADETGAAGEVGGGDGKITTPMPGKIVEVLVSQGDAVEPGQPLLILESMKMQNEINSDVKGIVKTIHFAAGDLANFGDPLVEIDVEEE
jgi:biotin carboxyl carrier protein